MHEKTTSDAEKFRIEVINVLTQTGFDKSSESGLFLSTFLASEGYFSNL